MFRKIDIGIAEDIHGNRVQLAGREAVILRSNDGSTFEIGLLKDQDTIEIMSAEIYRLTNGVDRHAVAPDEKEKVIRLCVEAMRVLSGKTILPHY